MLYDYEIHPIKVMCQCSYGVVCRSEHFCRDDRITLPGPAFSFLFSFVRSLVRSFSFSVRFRPGFGRSLLSRRAETWRKLDTRSLLSP